MNEHLITHTTNFHIQKSVSRYHELRELYGSERANILMQGILREDLHSQAWEIAKLPTPYLHAYSKLEENGKIKIVHGSDIHWGRDISEGVCQFFRRGTEATAVKNARSQLISMPVGSTCIWVSPKEVGYCEDTQLNLVRRVSDTEYQARQYQNSKLDYKDTARLVNKLIGKDVFSDDADIDQVITTVGVTNKEVDSERVWQSIEELTETPTRRDLDYVAKRIKRLSEVNARMLLEAIIAGKKVFELQKIHSRLLGNIVGLADTVPYITYKTSNDSPEIRVSTSCGGVSFSVSTLNVVSLLNILTSSFGKLTEIKSGKKCLKCGEINYCTAVCWKPECGGQLSAFSNN